MSAYRLPSNGRGAPIGEGIARELASFRSGVGYAGLGRAPAIALELHDVYGAAVLLSVDEQLAGELALSILTRLEQPPFQWRRRMTARARALSDELLAIARRHRGAA